VQQTGRRARARDLLHLNPNLGRRGLHAVPRPDEIFCSDLPPSECPVSLLTFVLSSLTSYDPASLDIYRLLFVSHLGYAQCSLCQLFCLGEIKAVLRFCSFIQVGARPTFLFCLRGIMKKLYGLWSDIRLDYDRER
jgi:hypothetical protein